MAAIEATRLQIVADPLALVPSLLLQDGVYPEKVNAGRVGSNNNLRRIGQNVEPVTVRAGSGKLGRRAGIYVGPARESISHLCC